LEIKRIASQSSAKGAERADCMAHASARSDSHRHGWLRLGTAVGGPIEEIRPGDVVWFPPGEKHRHGAAAATALTHIAIQEKKDGKVVDWLKQVTAEQYRGVA
jgi:hypothetical protein